MSRSIYTPTHKARKADLELEKNNYFKQMMNDYKEENSVLKGRCEQLEQEMLIVHWYQEVMEGGIDTKEMKKFYEKSKKKIDGLNDKYARMKEKMNKQVEELRLKLKVT